MSLEANLSKFICCLASDDHIVEKPARLSSCSHYVCKNCIKNRSDFKCLKCGELSNSTISSDEKSELEKEIKHNIGDLLILIEKRFNESLRNFKKSAPELTEQLYVKVEYLKQEIDIRIESLKCELDKINEDFQNRLDQYQNTTIKKLKKLVESNNENDFQRSHQELRYAIENKCRYTDELYRFQNELSIFDKKFKEVKGSICEAMFYPSDSEIMTNMIGNLEIQEDLSEKINNEEIREIQRHPKLKPITNVRSKIFDMCTLPNGFLVTASYTDGCLEVFDKKFALIKTITKIDNVSLKPNGLATDSKRHVFICDSDKHQVTMTDLDFNKIKAFGYYGIQSNQLKHPSAICYYKKHLYICDSTNQRIQKLNQNLELVTSYLFEFWPHKIKIHNDIAGVVPSNISSQLHFYYVDTFILKYKYIGHGGLLSQIGGSFYEYNSQAEKIFCYNDEGVLDEELPIIRSDKKIDQGLLCGGFFVQFDNKIVMAYKNSNNLFLMEHD